MRHDDRGQRPEIILISAGIVLIPQGQLQIDAWQRTDSSQMNSLTTHSVENGVSSLSTSLIFKYGSQFAPLRGVGIELEKSENRSQMIRSSLPHKKDRPANCVQNCVCF